MIIGAGVFLLVVVGAVFTVRSWQNNVSDVGDTDDTEQLLQSIANLDDAYEAGGMDESQYQKQREKLMSELAGMW